LTEPPDISLIDPDPLPCTLQPYPDEIKNSNQWNDWRWQLRHTITDFPADGVKLPARITPYYADLLARLGANHPLNKTMVPSTQELIVSPGEAQDPLGEDDDSPVPGLIHRYPDRVLFLVANSCAAYCRYCTRSRSVGQHCYTPDNPEAIEYIRHHPEIRDVVVSGGDPLTLTTSTLETVLKSLSRIPHVEMIRIGTKVPMVLPQRIDADLRGLLREYRPWISIHATHPAEITPEVEAACNALADCGCPLGSQTVLLKNINDDPEVMRLLMVKLLKMRVRPYYLYACDPVEGTSHFRCDPSVGTEIIRYLRGRISGYGVPTFVVDAPGGGGKIPVMPDYVVGRTETELKLRNWQEKEYRYPV